MRAAVAILRAGIPVLLLAVANVTAGCEDLLQEPDTGFSKITLRVEEVSGNGQTGTAGEVLDQPVRVRVLDGAEEPQPRLRVEWSVLDGSGRVEPRDTFSDEDGITEASWILGAAAGPQKLQARVNDRVFVIFSATAVAR